MVQKNDNVAEFDYGYVLSSSPTSIIDICGVYGDDEDCEANDESYEDVDGESNRDLDVQADGHVSSFHTYHHHHNLNMLKTLVMLFQVIGLHG